MKYSRISSCLIFLSIFFLPCILWGQHQPEITAQEGEENTVYMLFEWVEYIADVVGISILILGFVKGVFVFFKMEFDNITGGDTFDDILALRSTLGGYIILSLDFLIISDIIHSVIKPELWELLNLGIIVFLRTSIGFFLGREIMELRHNKKIEQAAEQQQEEA